MPDLSPSSSLSRPRQPGHDESSCRLRWPIIHGPRRGERKVRLDNPPETRQKPQTVPDSVTALRPPTPRAFPGRFASFPPSLGASGPGSPARRRHARRTLPISRSNGLAAHRVFNAKQTCARSTAAHGREDNTTYLQDTETLQLARVCL